MTVQFDHELKARRSAWTKILAGIGAMIVGALVPPFLFDGATRYVVAAVPFLGGIVLALAGMWRMEIDPATRGMYRRAWVEIIGGLALFVGGLVSTWIAFDEAATRGTPIGGWGLLVVGPLLAGLVLALLGLWRLASYKSFVALRYLLVPSTKVTSFTRLLIAITLAGTIGFRLLSELPPRLVGDVLGLAVPAGLPVGDYWSWLTLGTAAAFALALFVVVVVGVLRYSKPAFIVVLISFGIGALAVALSVFLQLKGLSGLRADQVKNIRHLASLVTLIAFSVTGIATMIGSLRAFFTFFTTVPIVGVWIGTAALVCVLAVMSGFETDLRDKILGSNAHIQITREDGEFLNWREVKARVDKIPGVVASTPYAVSEVVIAANNNGSNCIIKGIDPEHVGKVTNLVQNLEGENQDEKQAAMDRLQPRAVDGQDRTVPAQPILPPGPVVDPPPDDMPGTREPIDFSGPNNGTKDTPPRGSGAVGSDDFGGDAVQIVDAPDPRDVGAPAIVDPAPDDLIVSADEPTDYSDAGVVDDAGIEVIDIPLEPSLSQRTQALPGILVGKELAKQTHLYIGEEVRVVSPLSDPSNPDATGTPIPFNRDYRVAGVFFTGMYEYDLKYIYVTLDSLQDFLDRGDSIDGIEVRITDPDDTERYVPTEASAGLIREALGDGYRIQDWRELNRNLFSALKLEKIAMFLVLGIVILVASFSIIGNLIMVVVEKAREIALLKTLGASDFGVMQLFAIQGLVIGLIGTLLGVAWGLGACWAAKRYGLPLDPDVYYIDRLPIHVEPASVLASALAGIVISIAATFYPARLAAKVRPAAGMRH
ncbi:MAG: ABC transporter permease [Kofleriaceae bacterium]